MKIKHAKDTNLSQIFFPQGVIFSLWEFIVTNDLSPGHDLSGGQATVGVCDKQTGYLLPW